MDKANFPFIASRRNFLKNIVPIGALLCFGSSNILTLHQKDEKQKAKSNKHKFLNKVDMTYEQIFKFAYPRYIEIMQNLINYIGKDKFIELLKKASCEGLEQSSVNALKNLPKRDLITLATLAENNPPLYKNAQTYEFVEKTDNAFEVKVTECLWAKTFRQSKEPDAAEIGYASICHPDFAFARIFNPKIKLIRTKTLMQGHDCCNHRYVWEG